MKMKLRWRSVRFRLILMAFINAAILLTGSYFINNLPFLTGENLNLYAGLEYMKSRLAHTPLATDSVCLINVAYNKDIAIKKIDRLQVGTTDVTNRKELIKLLQNLKKCRYKYIFMDVRFEEGDETVYDKELFEQIRSMKNLVIADHKDIVLADPSLKEKAAYSDYYITITSTNFVRYQLLRPEGESMPLRAYRELNGRNDGISKHGWFFTSNGRLCQNTLVVRSPAAGFNEYGEPISVGNSQGRASIYHNLNHINDEESLSVLAHDKYVVIGDMVNDMHDTYFGKTPGSLLVFSAFRALRNGEHILKYGLMIVLFILYFAISLTLFYNKPVLERISFVRRSKLLRFLLTFIGYATVLTFAIIILYLCFGYVYSILFPALLFSMQKTYLNYKNTSL